MKKPVGFRQSNPVLIAAAALFLRRIYQSEDGDLPAISCYRHSESMKIVVELPTNATAGGTFCGEGLAALLLLLLADKQELLKEGRRPLNRLRHSHT